MEFIQKESRLDQLEIFNLILLSMLSILLGVSYVRFLTVHPLRIGLYASFSTSWKYMLQVLEGVGQPKHLGFQADMAHTLLYVLGFNAPEHRLVPEKFHWDPDLFHAGMKKLTRALRPWTIDFHVAQNDATVKGSGSHDKTGRHCLPNDPNGKLDISKVAGYWLRDEKGQLTRKIRHLCWDGCMFPNAVMMQPKTWNDILAVMLAVRDAHGWSE